MKNITLNENKCKNLLKIKTVKLEKILKRDAY